MTTMVAPQAYMQIEARSGNQYAADSQGIILNVPVLDVDDLESAGCVPVGVSSVGLVARLLGANMNSTADQQLTVFPDPSRKMRITKISGKGASVSLSTAVGGIFTGTAKSGTALVASTQVWTGLTGPTQAQDLGLVAAAAATVYPASTPLYLSLSTAQGAAALADIYVYGDLDV
jgi:hypothetical protein